MTSGCAVSPLQQSDPEPSLNWCPPLPNCVSTEASTFFHKIDQFSLSMPFEKAWPHVVASVNQLPRTEISHQYQGYIYAKSYSQIFGFVDYFEVLYQANTETLNVRSGSLLGISDLLVNYRRTEQLRESLLTKQVISPTD
ncbi:hypothetical protein A3752_07400 [Oleiphilus sp. HI0081]|jgi:uncharacterized protein (DUF1499 family)|nr:hypothetical protein A3732_03110 [Oleiphilus sp. HI0050]KZZ22055.1 hypothetical protein A3752_07400 [Oleiphilus sp. HI0081]KZZ38561.1 hypothetical protein A3757_07755 [Oleiphilus sp. HI0117]